MNQQPLVSYSGPFVCKQRVFWDQIDQLGVLHNAVYPLLFERARTELWRYLGISAYGDPGMDWPYLVARNEVNYFAAITSEQEVTVNVWVQRLGETSITFAHTVVDSAGVISAEGKTVIVRIDPESRRPTAWSSDFRALLARYVAPP